MRADREMVDAAMLVAERMKLVVELSAGASVSAALFRVSREWPSLRNVGVILCGGNVDLNMMYST